MSDFGATIETLKAAGFSEDEINQHTENRAAELVAAGFSDEEVNDYVGITRNHRLLGKHQ